MLDLLNDILDRLAAGETLAICTIVRTRGSTPQKAGAVLVVLRDGRTLGTIGGGCVEAEVRSKAMQWLAADTNDGAKLFSFSLDRDYGWDDGLVCGGAMDVAVERLSTLAAADQLADARNKLANGEPATVVVQALDAAGDVVRFERVLEPMPELVIAGAGHVGMALAAVAGQMEFAVTVIDDRADLASTERFPHARRIVGEIEQELARLLIHKQCYIVIVTRGHRHDGRALLAVARSQAKYIGLIGSKRKVLAIFDELRREGVSRAQLARVRAPIGLDVGAVTPGEIAVSIAAELVAVRRGVDELPAVAMRIADRHVDRLYEKPAPQDAPSAS